MGTDSAAIPVLRTRRDGEHSSVASRIQGRLLAGPRHRPGGAARHGNCGMRRPQSRRRTRARLHAASAVSSARASLSVQLADLVVADDERRRQQRRDRRAARRWCPHRVADQPFLQRRRLDPRMQLSRGVERGLGLPGPRPVRDRGTGPCPSCRPHAGAGRTGRASAASSSPPISCTRASSPRSWMAVSTPATRRRPSRGPCRCDRAGRTPEPCATAS